MGRPSWGLSCVEHALNAGFDPANRYAIDFPGFAGKKLVAGKPLEEPVAWYGPIVMNTQEQLRQAFNELEKGTFLKKDARG